MSVAIEPVATVDPRQRAAVRGGVVGNYVDQLHIFLPVTALAPALPTLVGPWASPGWAAAVVAATLLGRPIGAMMFGRIADVVGRTRTTRVAIAGTAACTLGISALPDHTLFGPATIGLLVALRFLAGVFLAGEYSAAIPLSMEWARPRARGLVSGLIMSMAPWAQATIALATYGLLHVLAPGAYAAWGWRCSFVAGGLASLAVLVYYSRNVRDAVGRRERPAGGALLRDVVVGAHRRAFWQMFGLMTGLWFMTNVVVLDLTTRLAGQGRFDAAQVSLVMAVAAIGQAAVMGVTGHLSTFVGRRRFLVGWGLAAALAGPLIWWVVVEGGHGVPVVAAGAALLQIVTVCAYGPMGAYLSEGFPARVRSTGYGTAYSASIVVPALHPWYLPTLQGWLGASGGVLLLLVLGGTLVAVCGAAGPRLAPAELDAPLEELSGRL